MNHLSLSFVFAALTLAAQPQIQLNALYDCSPSPLRIKVLSCTGPGDDAVCEVQGYNRTEAGPKAKDTRKSVSNLLKSCHVQTGAEAQVDARPAAARRTESRSAMRSKWLPAWAGLAPTSSGLTEITIASTSAESR
ncbi:MAG TPA: hypothetical protein VNX18_17780 [Bryobacteraceae bacterium]|nr:hypothetical protein [Bryobacteraceae bacterium]